MPAASSSAPAGSWIRVARRGDRPGVGRGLGSRPRRSKASWDLTFAGDAAPCSYLPADWLYEAPLPRTKFVAPYPDARFDGSPRARRRVDRARRLAGDDRPQLGQRARRALGLARGHRFARLARHLLRRRRRPGQARRAGRAPGSPRGCWCSTARRTASAASARSARPRSRSHRAPASSLLPGKDIVVRGRVSAPAEGLRRLGLRGPQGPRAQHGQLLGRRPRADGRAPGAAGPRAEPRRPAPPTSWACGRPTTASRSSPTPTAEQGAVPQAPMLLTQNLLEAHPVGVGAERGLELRRRGSW